MVISKYSYEYGKSSLQLALLCFDKKFTQQHLNTLTQQIPGGVYVSTEECTRTDRLLEGMGIFLSLYFARAACTASVWTSTQKTNKKVREIKFNHNFFLKTQEA